MEKEGGREAGAGGQGALLSSVLCCVSSFLPLRARALSLFLYIVVCRSAHTTDDRRQTTAYEAPAAAASQRAN